MTKKANKGRRAITEARWSPDDGAATAADAYEGHLRAISALLLDTLMHVETLRDAAHGRKITWTEVASMTRAREFTVEAAWALGAITAANAKAKHGVSI